MEPRLYGMIGRKAKELGATVHAIGGTEWHIHLLVSLPPTLTVSTFIGQIKGASSYFVNHVLQPNILFRWQTEYGVVTVDDETLGRVVRYVLGQKEHHAKKTLWQRFEQTGQSSLS